MANLSSFKEIHVPVPELEDRIHNPTLESGFLVHLTYGPWPSLGGGLVERISDRELAARQVPDTTLDNRLTEGITYLEHPAPGVSLDSGPMEGMSCLEPLKQSNLQSSWIARPRECAMKERSECSYTLDSRHMEGITYLEHSALGVSLDSGHTEGALRLEPLEQWVFSSSLAARPVESIRSQAGDINPDGRPMEGFMYPEHLAPGCLWTVDSGRRGC